MSIEITVYGQMPISKKLQSSEYIKLKRNATIIRPFLNENSSTYLVYRLLPKK